ERYYECADGWIGIACATSSRYAALASALGLQHRDAEEALTEEREGPLASQIAEMLKTLSVGTALTRLQDAHAPAAPVLAVDDVYGDGGRQDNGCYESYVDPTFGPAMGVAGFARF